MTVDRTATDSTATRHCCVTERFGTASCGRRRGVVSFGA